MNKLPACFKKQEIFLNLTETLNGVHLIIFVLSGSFYVFILSEFLWLLTPSAPFPKVLSLLFLIVMQLKHLSQYCHGGSKNSLIRSFSHVNHSNSSKAIPTFLKEFSNDIRRKWKNTARKLKSKDNGLPPQVIAGLFISPYCFLSFFPLFSLL